MIAGPVPRLRHHLRQASGRDTDPLTRTVDRARSRALLLAGLGFALAALGGVCVAAADLSTARHQASATAAHLHRAQAVALGPAQRESGIDRGRARYRADAAWPGADGRTVTGRVLVPAGTTPGTAVDIWLDDAGRPVAAPRGTPEIAAEATCLGLFTFGCLSALVGAGLGLRLNALDRRAEQEWQRGWALVEPSWSGRVPRDDRAA